MNRRVQYLGIVGLIFIIFGVLINILVAYDEYMLVPIHLFIGLLFVITFVVRGGLQLLGTAAVKRAAGFGAGVTVYSTLFVGIIVLSNYFVSRHDFLHFDSTEEKVYTLAPQTLQVLQALKGPIKVQAFYLGGKIDPEAESLLNRISRASDKFTWAVIDPEKKKALADKMGIRESGTLCFSYEINGITRESKIVRDVSEQEIVNSILKLTRGGEKTIYYISGHGEADLEEETGGGFLFLKESIQGENLQVKKLVLSENAEIPSDAAALLLLAPRRSLLPTERSSIERYLSRGGNALFLTEPNTVNDVSELVKPLGIEVGNNMIVDQEVRLFAGPSLGLQPMVTQYGIHPVTEEFKEGTVFSTVTSVSKSAQIPADATVTELALTSASSWAEKDLEKLLAEEPTASLDAEDIKGPVPMAAAFEGTIPNKAGEASSEKEKEQSSSEKSTGKSRVVVIGDTDFVANINLRLLYNRDFFLNALNWVVGQEQGVSIRAKTLRRSITGISQEQFSAIFLITAILCPELLLSGGLAVWWFRKE